MRLGQRKEFLGRQRVQQTEGLLNDIHVPLLDETHRQRNAFVHRHDGETCCTNLALLLQADQRFQSVVTVEVLVRAVQESRCPGNRCAGGAGSARPRA